MGKCSPYASLNDFVEADNLLVCKSGFIGQQIDNGLNVCMPAPKIVNKQGSNDFKCSSPQDTCVYESSGSSVNGGNSVTFEKSCSCGLNPFGISFCPNIYTDSYTSLLAQVTTKLAANCHTLNRHDIYSCLTPNVKNE